MNGNVSIDKRLITVSGYFNLLDLLLVLHKEEKLSWLSGVIPCVEHPLTRLQRMRHICASNEHNRGII